MNNVDNHNISDFTKEEIAIRDHFLHKSHSAPNVQDELASFMQKNGMLQSDSIEQDVVDDEGTKHRGIAIGVVLAIAASLLLVFILHIGKQKRGLDIPDGAVVAYNAEEAEDSRTTCTKIETLDAGVADNCGSSEHVVVRKVLTTPSNATAEVTLADGTVVTVNAGSKFIYPQSFKGTTREVELQGEAYFKVRHDARHPFVVHSNGIATQVLGTEFNVRSYTQDKTHVTLVRGRVKVSTSSSEKFLKPGEDVALYGGVLKARDVDTEEYTAWKDGEFYFDNETLLDVAKEIGKWYHVSVIFQSPEKMYTRIFFAAPRDGNIEELLEVLNGLNKAKFVYHDDQVVIE